VLLAFLCFFALFAVVNSTTFNTRERSVTVGFRMAILLESPALYEIGLGGSICMVLFCKAVMLKMSLLFSAGSKSTKNKFGGSSVILCCAIIMLQAVLLQTVSVLYLRFLLSDVDI
jgi:hypothetical protein